MADKGFDINDLLREHNVLLNILPSLESQVQFSPQDDQNTKTIVNLKIHVKWAIRRVKEYHFFDLEFLYLL